MRNLFRTRTAADIKEVYAEAKGNGFDTKVLRKVISLRKKDANEREEEEAMLEPRSQIADRTPGSQPRVPIRSATFSMSTSSEVKHRIDRSGSAPGSPITTSTISASPSGASQPR